MKIKNNWTEAQWDAITENDCNLLVAAAAGAGKTAVLVERIMCKITDPANSVDIDRLLIMTFTNAAAAEMRDRISSAISYLLENNSDNYGGNIQKQLTLLSKASITTIHSFCLEVVRSNFQRIDIDPGFKIMEDTEAVLMKIEVINELFDEKYENDDQDFFELLDCYGGKSDDLALQEIALDLYDFIQRSPWPDKWFYEMTEGLNLSKDLDFIETSWGRVLVNSVAVQLRGMRDAMSKALAMISNNSGLEKYRYVFAEDLSNLELLLDKCTRTHLEWDDIYREFVNQKFMRLPPAGKDADKEIQEAVKEIRNEAKARLEKIKKTTFYSDSSEVIKDISSMYPVIKSLVGLVLDFAQRFSDKKSKKSVVDFNDLEHFCLEILTQRGENGEIIPSAAAEGYRDRYFEVLVDEYQDSNLIQEAIIRMVSRIDRGTPNIFMVGDVKQSIYRFRQARPELFLEKYRNYSSDKGSPYRKIVLLRNFRSRREVIDGINFIFKQIMSKGVGELDYDEVEYLNPGASFPENDREKSLAGGPVELHLIETKEVSREPLPHDLEEPEEFSEDEEAEEERLDDIQAEARLVAGRIKTLLQGDAEESPFSVYDRGLGTYRQAEYRDIVILLRTVKKWSDIFSEEFEIQKIPVFADIGTGFFKTPEVQVILSLLQIIDNPIQDIPLLSVLRSPIVSFSTEDLADLRLMDKRANLYEALQLLAEKHEGEAGAKSRLFLLDLQRWRDTSLYLPIDQLLWQIYSETGYLGIVGAMPGGEQRQANLHVLFERARQYEEGSYRGLFNFINFVDKLKSSRGDMGSAKLLGENDNVVRIMSIHKSKGLEFPIVFLAGTGKRINLQDMNKSILVHQELGFGPDVVDHRERIVYPSLSKQAIRDKIKVETYSEELRILYVALTRAREKLIITGALNNIEARATKWFSGGSVKVLPLPEDGILKSCNYLDWLGAALIRHKKYGGALRIHVRN
ncbi:MAG: helicase-exonuclease AddAB subunit AddA, partial [Peptococcaceae bacterium]|nr:helicase-exonuclease AddAB subunit AddA [Peptococcaceae bacterium]